MAQIPTDNDVAKFAGPIGDGTTTSFAVLHGLNSTNVHVTVKETTSGDVVIPKVTITNATTVTVAFSQPPASNFYTVEVIG